MPSGTVAVYLYISYKNISIIGHNSFNGKSQDENVRHSFLVSISQYVSNKNSSKPGLRARTPVGTFLTFL